MDILRHILLLAVGTAAHRVSSSHASPSSRDGETSADHKTVFRSHPFLGVVPVPVTPEEIEAAQKPGYIYWLAEKNNEKRSDLASRFATAEHAYLGDSLVLQGPNGVKLPPGFRFSLPNGVNVTYGEINCLAGDFYAIQDAISDGVTLEEQVARFNKSFALLGRDTTRQPQEVNQILAVAAEERNAFAAAVAKGTNPSAAYATLKDRTFDYEWITSTRPSTQPGYIGLSANNFDHFGPDARAAYDAGHTAALRAAARGDLLGAYTLNAFADHFLEDSFAAGHLRTPRRYLHSTFFNGLSLADLSSKYMHDEDNAIGLAVTNPKGDAWTCRGDNYLMDLNDRDNAAHAHNALQISVAEVLAAFQTRRVPDPTSFGAWSEAPTLESARGHQTLAPLFTLDGQRRYNLKDRRTWRFTSSYYYVPTVAEIKLSGLWDYPIVLG